MKKNLNFLEIRTVYEYIMIELNHIESQKNSTDMLFEKKPKIKERYDFLLSRITKLKPLLDQSAIELADKIIEEN